MRVLDHHAVRALLDPGRLVRAVADAMVDLSLGRASLPPRIAARVTGAGLLSTMPAYCPTLDVLAASCSRSISTTAPQDSPSTRR